MTKTDLVGLAGILLRLSNTRILSVFGQTCLTAAIQPFGVLNLKTRQHLDPTVFTHSAFVQSFVWVKTKEILLIWRDKTLSHFLR